MPLARNQEDSRAFDFFRSHSAGQLSGFFDSRLWSRLVLQASHDNPIIEHGVVALGSLFKISRDENLMHGTISNQHAFQEYNRAMKLLNQDLGKLEKHCISTTLISCLLFIAMESMQGNWEGATTLMRTGSVLIRNWQEEYQVAKPEALERSIDGDLLNMFARMNIAVSARTPDHLRHTTFEPAWTKGPVPECFGSLCEARDWLYGCSYSTARHLGVCNVQIGLPVAGHGVLLQWLSAFRAFTDSNSIGIRHKDYQGVLLLEITFNYMKILSTLDVIASEEVQYDAFMSEFDKINSLTSTLINDFELPSRLEGRRQHRDRAHFSFEPNPLCYVCGVGSKCREPWIRRRALSLLSSVFWQDCWGNSQTMYALVERIILIEEHVLDIQDIRIANADEVTTRLTLVNATISPEERTIVAQFLRTENGEEAGIQDECITY